MKHILWLALLLPLVAFADPDNESFDACAAGGPSQDCNHINEAAVRLDALEDVEIPAVPFIAKLGAVDSAGTVFNSFIQANGTGDTVFGFTVYLEQPDGTFATVTISPSSGIWGTGGIRYSGTNCTGTKYYIAAWTWNTVGSVEGAIVINSQAGFDGIPYTFAIGPLFSATVVSNSVPGHPITAPVCNDFSPFVQTGLRLAIPVQGLPAVVVPPVVATIQLSP